MRRYDGWIMRTLPARKYQNVNKCDWSEFNKWVHTHTQAHTLEYYESAKKPTPKTCRTQMQKKNGTKNRFKNTFLCITGVLNDVFWLLFFYVWNFTVGRWCSFSYDFRQNNKQFRHPLGNFCSKSKLFHCFIGSICINLLNVRRLLLLSFLSYWCIVIAFVLFISLFSKKPLKRCYSQTWIAL